MRIELIFVRYHMFAVEATNERQWRWISGVFSELSKAEQYLQSVPEPQRANQRMVRLPVAKYPVLIIEDQGFEYGDVNFVRARLRELEPCGDEDHVHMSVYAVLKDFEPSVAGVDSMSKLSHWHINDWYLTPPLSTYFDQELEEIASNA